MINSISHPTVGELRWHGALDGTHDRHDAYLNEYTWLTEDGKDYCRANGLPAIISDREVMWYAAQEQGGNLCARFRHRDQALELWDPESRELIDIIESFPISPAELSPQDKTE